MRFSLHRNGRYEIFVPTFQSPLGILGSYAKMELTDETKIEITAMLYWSLPRIRSLGLEVSPDPLHANHASVIDRVADTGEFEYLKNQLTAKNFIIKSIL